MAPKVVSTASIRKGAGTNATTRWSCSAAGCPGTCPLKVIVHKASIGQPATCNECGRKYQCPSWAKTLFPQPTRNLGKPAAKADASMAQLRQQNAELHRQLKNLKGGKPEPADNKPKVNLGDLQAMVDLAKKIGDEGMVRTAQKSLDEAKKAEKGVTDPLKAIVDKLARDRKRKDQAAAQVVQAKQKLAALEAAAMDAAKQFVQTHTEWDRLLRVHGHKTAESPPADSKISMPAPASLPDDRRQVWDQVLAEVALEAERLAKAKLASTFPDLFQESMVVDGGANQEDTAEEPPAKKPTIEAKTTSLSRDDRSRSPPRGGAASSEGSQQVPAASGELDQTAQESPNVDVGATPGAEVAPGLSEAELLERATKEYQQALNVAEAAEL